MEIQKTYKQYNRYSRQHYSSEKHQICLDVAEVFANNALSPRAKKAVLVQAAWDWTTFDGKFAGCKYWSTRALVHLNDVDVNAHCIHEHAIPIGVLIRLLEAANQSKLPLGRVFKKYCIGAVIHREEDSRLNSRFKSKMPPDWDRANPFARYSSLDEPIQIKTVRWARSR